MKRNLQPALLLSLTAILLTIILARIDSLQAFGQGSAVGEPIPRSYFPLVRIDRPERTEFDMADFMVGDGRLYEVWHSNDSQARHQTQFENSRFFHTKGIPLAEWEELWIDNNFVYRGTDTSPGDGRYYTLRNKDTGQYGSKWAPRYWRVGDVYERFPLVTFYYKSGCAQDVHGTQQTWLKFAAYYPKYTFGSGIVVDEVIALDWLLSQGGQPEERYFYARDYGLVGWQNSKGDYSYVSEVHAPGTRPDNTREVISCLDTGGWPVPDLLLWPELPNVPPYRAK